MKTAVTVEIAKATPPVYVTTWAWVQGLPLDKYVAIATLLYIVIQIGYLLWKWVREYRGKA